MSISEYRLTLKPGPYLLYLPGQMDQSYRHETIGEELAVTRKVHQFLYDDVLVAADVKFSDLLLLGQSNAALHAVFERYGSRQTAQLVKVALANGTIKNVPNIAIRIIPSDGWVDLEPVEIASLNEGSGAPELDSFEFLELLSMRLEMSTHQEERDFILPNKVPKTVPSLVRLGELLRTAYLISQHYTHRRPPKSETYEEELGDFEYDGDSDPNYNHDNGPDRW